MKCLRSLGFVLLFAAVGSVAQAGTPHAKTKPAAVAAVQPAVAPVEPAPLVPTDDPHIRRFEFAPMGVVAAYLPTHVDDATDVVVFASGDGGWDQGFIDMVARIQRSGRIVIGFSTPEYLKRLDASTLKCGYPPQELEALSQFVQRKLDIPSYRIPMLVGYSSGASLAYVAAAQTPINTFAGVIGLGFCADLALAKPLCRQGALTKVPVKASAQAAVVRLEPIAHLVAPLEVLHGQDDDLCKLSDVETFFKRTGNANLTALPKVGHGFGVVGEWFAQFSVVYKALDEKRPADDLPTAAAVAGLPLIERPIQSPGDTFVVMLSGDGGWSTLTDKVAAELNSRGIPVVGWNMLKYFWSAKSPDRAGADLGAIIGHYADAWHKDVALLVGYSMGADVLPALVNRLPVAEQQRVRSIVLMAPERATDFEFHLGGWLQHVAKDATPIAPEVEKLPDGMRVTCIYGSDEADRSLCTQLDRGEATLTLQELPGAHHFDGDYAALAQLVK